MLAQASIEHLPVADNSIDLIFTDPPYDRASIYLYDWLAIEAARVLKNGGFCLAMCGGMFLNQNFAIMDKHLVFHWKFEIYLNGFSATPIWPRSVVARSKPILAYSKGKGNPRQGNILGAIVGGGQDKRFHHWGQDVESARYYIDVLSSPGEIVLDPFVGGGTTLVACELIGRRGIGFDIDPTALTTTGLRIENAEIPHQETFL